MNPDFVNMEKEDIRTENHLIVHRDVMLKVEISIHLDIKGSYVLSLMDHIDIASNERNRTQSVFGTNFSTSNPCKKVNIL